MFSLRKQVLGVLLAAGVFVALGFVSGIKVQSANGRTATHVQFASGSFVLTPGSKWVEVGANRAVKFTFAEQNRDDWSVYLFDASRNVRLQLNLHTRKVMYSEGTGPARPIYDIIGSSAAVNGRNVVAAAFAGGSLRMSGAKAWTEFGKQGPAFRYVETQRDDWSVYLTDTSRGVRLQVDLHRKVIGYADRSAPNMRDLYAITGSTAIAQ